MTRSRQPSRLPVHSTTVPTAPARVAFVGAGPGDPGLMTLRGRELLAAASVVIIDRIARDDVVLAHARAGVEVVDASHGEQGQQLTHAMRAKIVVKTAKAAPRDGLVVRLMDGDPALFNGLVEEMRACRKAGIGFDVVPGVSAAAAVPMYAGVPLTCKQASSVHVVSTENTRIDWSRYAGADGSIVLLGSPASIRSGLAGLRRAGHAGTAGVALMRHGTTFAQTTVTTTLDEVDAALTGAVKAAPSVAVVSSTVALREEFSWFETKPLYGWRVLVPRTQAQAGPMVDRLSGYGATAEVVPTISVEPPRTPQQMERAVKGLVTGRYEWIGFTSVNAVRAVRERFELFGLDARAFAGLKVAAVGGVTAGALREWGINPDLAPSGEQSAAGLLADWPPYDEVLDPINRVLLPRADIATETLVAGLREMGWEVDNVTAYRTVRATPPPAPIRDAIKGGDFDAVLFTSSSTVRNLVGIAGKPHPTTVIACIGPATAKTAQEHGLRVDVLAPEASAMSIVDALAGYGMGLIGAAVEAGQPVQRPSDRRPASRRRAK